MGEKKMSDERQIISVTLDDLDIPKDATFAEAIACLQEAQVKWETECEKFGYANLRIEKRGGCYDCYGVEYRITVDRPETDAELTIRKIDETAQEAWELADLKRLLEKHGDKVKA